MHILNYVCYNLNVPLLGYNGGIVDVKRSVATFATRLWDESTMSMEKTALVVYVKNLIAQKVGVA